MAETKNNTVITGKIPSNDIWPQFGIPAINLGADIKIDCDISTGLAAAVLTEYGILEYSDKAGVVGGGDLTNLDIKRMDAMTVLNLSLIEAAAIKGGLFVEPIVNGAGVVEFTEIGKDDGLIEDIYYEISTGHFVDTPKGVMVTGGRPLPTIKELQWYPIWGESAVRIYHSEDMLLNCRKTDFIRHTSIVFNDPQLTTAYGDGIDNLYPITVDNPWDRVIGYAKFINPGTKATKDTVINYTNSSTVPLQIGKDSPGANGPDLGTLMDKPTFDVNIYNPSCWHGAGVEASYEDGVMIDIPGDLRYATVRLVSHDKFLKVSEVYVVGKRIQTLSIAPINEAAANEDPSTSNAKLIVSIEDSDDTTVKLDPGKHYAVAYEDLGTETGKIPYVVFVKDVTKGDPFDYGKNQNYYPDPTCKWAQQNGLEGDVELTGTIFPHTKLKGILVTDIWVKVDLETPSITIYDPGIPTENTGANALEIATEMEYYISPIVMVEPPAPIAYAGVGGTTTATLVNQVPPTDNDPTTVESFKDRDIETYMDGMQGGGMAVTWSFLDETSVKGMCDLLYAHFQSDVTETIFTCGPECTPLLGGYGEHGGVVNAIRYNYTDSGSYTVSVTEGPKLIGNLAQIDGGPSMKMAENFSASGVVIDYAGDNIHFKLRIDGYGERWSVNMTHRVLKIGDVVQCTVHNNPVEA